MKRPDLAAQARRQLDRRIRPANLRQLAARPHRGWIRAVRGALAMTQANLAARLGVSAAAVAQLEQGEATGHITLAKLSEVAAALDCNLVYALVPNTSLEETVTRQARKVAANRLGYVAGTMALEDQAVPGRLQAKQVERTAQEIVADGSLWREASPRARRRHSTR